MIFNDQIVLGKLKQTLLLLLFIFVANVSFSQNYPTCTNTGNTVTVNGTCLVRSVQNTSNAFEAPVTGTYPCLQAAAAMDCWLKFVATASTATIAITTTNTAMGPAFSVYDGSCPSGTIVGTQLNCTDNVAGNAAQTETGNLTGLTIGTTYWIRVMRTGTAATANFTCCVTANPDNDDPNTAQPLAISSGTCNFITGSNTSSTLSNCGTIPAPGCAGLSGTATDVWYSVTIPASGNVFIQTEFSGTPAPQLVNGGLAAYTGSPCGAMTLIGCADSTLNGQNSLNSPGLYISGQPNGTIVYIRVWNKNATAKGFFKICASDMGPCGNLLNNDFCSNPASMTQGVGSFSSTTTASPSTYSYTSDAPGNVGNVALCSNNLSQNSWYSFMATLTTHTFAFNITGCAGGMAVQAFSVNTQNSCCKIFTSVGSCLGNSVTPSSGATGAQTLTLNSLTPGVKYYIMIESANSPQVCTYTVSGWTATGILPINLVSFSGENRNNVNYIEWVTSSEENISSYILENSPDGIDFKKTSEVQALQNGSSSQQHYHTYDPNAYNELTYYRLRQVKTSGMSDVSHIITILGPDFYETLHNLYPNPTTSDLNFDLYSKRTGSISVELLGYGGKLVYAKKYDIEEGTNTFVVPMNELSKGVYILKVVSGKSGKTTHHKIIKN
ncbi:MAG: T9SS type A sorting domain-containing protein [Bacteroidota bacterium]